MKGRAARAFSVALLTCSTSYAQTREADAERLFREGQALLEERRYGEACPKFEAAYRKDGALGTLINLAFCHKEQGAIWYAWLEFREAEVKAVELNRPERRNFAHARLAELEKSLPKVVIDNPQNVALTEVLVEDRKVWEAERGTVFAAEVGKRKLTFRAKGKKQATILVVVAALTRGARPQRVGVPVLEDATTDDLPPPAPASPPAPVPVVVAPVAPRALPPAPRAQRTMGWVTIGASGAAAAIGAVTGALSFFGPCGHHACGADERDNASTTAAISTVSFIVAGVALTAGVVLVLTAPSAPGRAGASSPRLALGAGPGGGGVTGSF